MNRLVVSVIAVLLATACGEADVQEGSSTPVPEPAPESSAPPPNVIVILLDDLGYSDIGAYGGEIRTPNVDRLAQEGRSFSQFYVYPRCSPTRAALLTGMYPHQVGMGFLTTPADANPAPGAYQGYLAPEIPTIAEALKEAGYATYMSGKWHLGEADENWPTKRGFDHYFGLISGASSYFEIIENQSSVRRMALDGEPWTPPADGFYMTDAITDQAAEYLADHEATSDDQPFFLYLAYTAPHWPLHAPEEDIAAYDGVYDGVYDGGWEAVAADRRAGLEAHGLGVLAQAGLSVADKLGAWADYDEKDDWIRKMQVYAAMVTVTDRGIGEIMQLLEEQGEASNTIVLFMSDNGASSEDVSGRNLNDPSKAVGERGSYVAYGPQGAAVSNSPLREYKGSTLEGGIRSPFIVHWPGQVVPGMDQDSVISVLDIAPSIAALASTSPMVSEGADIRQTLLGERVDSSRPIYWEHLGWRAVRDGRFKAVSPMGSDQWNLFDMIDDPAETNDIASENPELVEQLSANWEAWSERSGARTLSREELMKIYMPASATTSDEN